MKCEIIDGIVLPTDDYIFLRDKFRVYNQSGENKNIKIELYYSRITETVSETVILKHSAWYDFSEVLRDYFVRTSYYHVICRSPEVPQELGLIVQPPVYVYDGIHVVRGANYYIDNVLVKNVVFTRIMDCPPPRVMYMNRNIFRALPIKENYGEVILYGKIVVPTQEPLCCDCNGNCYVLHPWESRFNDEWQNSVEVNISGSLVQNDNCKNITRKRMARINYLRGDGTGIIRWCEVANETIKTAQTKSSQRLVNKDINLWVNDTHNDIKRTVTLEWRDFPPDEIDRIAMGVALSPTCYIYMDNGTNYSGTLEQSATLKVAGDLQITLNVEIA